VINDDDKRAFWETVADCLVAFHGNSKQDATAQCSSLRNTIESGLTLRGDAREYIYHDDPFWLACQMMGQMLDVEDYADAYETILESHGIKLPRVGNGTAKRSVSTKVRPGDKKASSRRSAATASRPAATIGTPVRKAKQAPSTETGHSSPRAATSIEQLVARAVASAIEKLKRSQTAERGSERRGKKPPEARGG
jgi:hypothetical protein